jgi:acyl-CoA thioesterase-2
LTQAAAARTAAPFYAPRATDDPHRFVLDATPELCVGPPERQFLMGGVGLASAIAAMERVTGRPIVWATAQYLSYAQPGDRLELSVETPVVGHRVSQARVVSRVGEREILGVAGALGARDSESLQFVRAPEAPPPDACDPVPWPYDGLANLMARFERRRAAIDESRGRALLWMRSRSETNLDAGLLAIVADFFAGFLERTRAAMSLDNTIRIHRIPEDAPAGWLLCDAHFAGIDAGSFHGEMNLFDEAGALLASASQSAMLPRAPLAAP